MAFNLKNRHLLSLVNHSEREIKYLLDLSRDLKRAKYAGTEQQKLKGKNILTIVNGKIVFENGKFSDKLENGREVEFYE